MILSMRRQAPVLMAVALVGVSLVSAAQAVISNVPAPKAVTFDEVRVFVYTTLAMVLLAVCGSAAGLVAFVLNRDRAAAAAATEAAAAAVAADHEVRKEQFAVIGDGIKAVGKSVDALREVIQEHQRDPFAHPAAAHSYHKVIEDRIEKLAIDMSEHVEFCRTHQCAIGSRDPRESLHPRRADDPADSDFRDSHRGKAS